METQTKKHIILLVDKKGKIAHKLCLRLKDDSQLLVITDHFQLAQSDEEASRRISHIPFWTTIPIIPDIEYSHILVVYGKQTGAVLPEFVKKAKHDDSIITIIVSLKEYDQHVFEQYILEKNVRVAIIGDLFDGKTIFDPRATITRFLTAAKLIGKIELPGVGTALTYPIFLPDAIDELLKITFHQQQIQGPFLLYPKHPPTELSVAHMMQKVDPLIKIDFLHQEPEGKAISVPESGAFVFGPSYPLQARIKHVLQSDYSLAAVQEAEESEVLEELKAQTSPRFSFGSAFLFIVVLLLFLVILPITSTIAFSFMGAKMLQNTKTMLEKGDLPRAKQHAIFSKGLLTIAKTAEQIVSYQANLVGRNDQEKKLAEGVSSLDELAQATREAIDGALFMKRVFTEQSLDAKSDFQSGINSIKNALTIFEKSQIQQTIRQISTDSGQSLNQLQQFASPFINTSDVFPAVFGFDREKTYLVLFQNNMELRPSGGFIGSYGLLSLERGRIKKFSVFDVYDADGELKGHVEPPYPVRRHLPQVHWYMRDSNFDVDFIKSMETTTHLLQLETGQTVDGVIALDTTVLKQVISSFGQVLVSDYNESVTADNFFLITEKHAEKNSFPGSTQKRDFLRSLVTAISLRLSEGKDISYFKLLEAVAASTAQKHILLAFSDPTIQSVFTINNLSSSLWDQRVQKDTLVNDFLGINEANLGVNKANYFLKRSIDHNIFISQEGSIAGKISVSYQNTSKIGQWPGGEYKAYLRAILPQGAVLTSVAFDGNVQAIVPAIVDPIIYEAKTFQAPSGLEVQKEEEAGKTIYGFLVAVQAQTSKTITISYTLSQKLSQDSPTFSYDLRVFKQPGTDNDPYTFSLIYPQTYRVLNTSPGILDKTGHVSFEGKMENDINLHINFAKK